MKHHSLLAYTVSAVALTGALVAGACSPLGTTTQSDQTPTTIQDSATPQNTQNAQQNPVEQEKQPDLIANPYSANLLTYTPAQPATQPQKMLVPVEITKNDNVFASVSYDDQGRVSKLFITSGTDLDWPPTCTRSYVYEGDKLSSYTEDSIIFDEETHNTFTCVYDDQGRLIESNSQENPALSRKFSYNADGWLTMFSAVGQEFDVSYDDKGRPIRYVSQLNPSDLPLTGLYENSYRDDGKLQSQIFNFGTQEPDPYKLEYTYKDGSQDLTVDLYNTRSFKKFDDGPFSCKSTVAHETPQSGTLKWSSISSTYETTYDKNGNLLSAAVTCKNDALYNCTWKVTYKEITVAPINGSILRAINLVPTFTVFNPFVVLVNDPATPIPHGVDPRYDIRAGATLF